MEQIAHQIGGLLLGSVPTMVFFVLLIGAYALLVRRPLDAVLLKRQALTTGAIEQARGAMAAAEAETTVFEDKLRSAKAEIFAAREKRLGQWAAEREALLAEARAATATRIAEARLDIEKSAAAARQYVDSMSGELSEKILRAVLPAGVSGTEAVQ